KVSRAPRRIADTVLLNIDSRDRQYLRMGISTVNSGILFSTAATVGTLMPAVTRREKDVRASFFQRGHNAVEGMVRIVRVVPWIAEREIPGHLEHTPAIGDDHRMKIAGPPRSFENSIKEGVAENRVAEESSHDGAPGCTRAQHCDIEQRCARGGYQRVERAHGPVVDRHVARGCRRCRSYRNPTASAIKVRIQALRAEVL